MQIVLLHFIVCIDAYDQEDVNTWNMIGKITDTINIKACNQFTIYNYDHYTLYNVHNT